MKQITTPGIATDESPDDGDGDDPRLLLGCGLGWRTLDFALDVQRSAHVCWAAVAGAVAAFYDPETRWTQRAIIAQAFHADSNRFFYADRALKIVGNYAATVDGPLAFAELAGQIAQHRVVVARVQWSFGGGHLVALMGVSERREVLVADPMHGPSVCAHEALTSGEYLGWGKWTHSYLTRPSPA